ncbi:hypothetical protein CHL78_002910 [Romboutsia weinsteinii]|uniref:Uncharacterized protein n=1 Tax=Romboutsia weinsteinii TaxID=2020949 RepID=A0A371J7Z9_9FIRM|nr:hypothetical protein [Romboutsia weinsteinii]RDY28889.1 hypothetical protein CHL78_002910 [Romboutsia weinsteinii]
MKKLLLDLGVYIGAPILLFNLAKDTYITYFIIVLAALGGFYSVSTKRKEERINISGIIFMILYVSMFLFRKDIDSEYKVYIYDTYFLISGALAILLLNIFGKNLVTRVYVDISRARGYNNLSIWSSIRKNHLDISFNKLSTIVATQLLVISFIKVYSISNYGASNYTSTQDLEVLVCMLFIILEIYMISKTMSNIKYKPNNKSKSKSKYNLNDRRVINLSQYKNTNK